MRAYYLCYCIFFYYISHKIAVFVVVVVVVVVAVAVTTMFRPLPFNSTLFYTFFIVYFYLLDTYNVHAAHNLYELLMKEKEKVANERRKHTHTQ